MKNLILLFVSCVLLGCSSDETPELIETPFVPFNITPTLISKRNNIQPVGITQQNVIYNSESDWNALLNQIDSFYQPFGINFTQLHFTETNIDFAKFSVIAVFDKVYGSGGYSIDITNIVENENNITVTVANLQTGNASSVITQPYHIVKIPKTSKPFVFN
ncbi:MAG: hypothetical protein ACI9XR_001349 [Flavobacterium sp.]|jgi:hypothetical protein